ncbi:MAG: hypothetical protein R2748_31080 [Bryobacterales bacterium]
MRLSYLRGNPRRAALLLLFAGLLYTAKTSENPTPADERTFEASRTGFQSIEYPGPLTRKTSCACCCGGPASFASR